jgi:hypothetical protein
MELEEKDYRTSQANTALCFSTQACEYGCAEINI